MRIDFARVHFGRTIKRIMQQRSHGWEYVKGRTGLSAGTLNRVLEGKVRNIDAILSLCDFYQLDINDFLHRNNMVREIDRIKI